MQPHGGYDAVLTLAMERHPGRACQQPGGRSVHDCPAVLGAPLPNEPRQCPWWSWCSSSLPFSVADGRPCRCGTSCGACIHRCPVAPEYLGADPPAMEGKALYP